MSTLINLLPDIRQAKLQEVKRRQIAIGVSVVLWIVCGSAIGLMAIYSAGQKVLINNATSRISDKKNQLTEMKDLIPAMTAAQHLESLPGLYAKRVYLTTFFKAYTEADPTSIAITNLGVDATNVLTASGTAPSYAEVAKLARALEASNVTVGTGAAAGNVPYFSSVNISSVQLEGTKIRFSIAATVGQGAVSGK